MGYSCSQSVDLPFATASSLIIFQLHAQHGFSFFICCSSLCILELVKRKEKYSFQLVVSYVTDREKSTLKII